jgi:hypothetical protein
MKYIDLIMTIKIYFCNCSHMLKPILVIYTFKSNFDTNYPNINHFTFNSLLTKFNFIKLNSVRINSICHKTKHVRYAIKHRRNTYDYTNYIYIYIFLIIIGIDASSCVSCPCFIDDMLHRAENIQVV